MYKPNSLRKHLSDSIADLKQNPDKLLVFADEGQIVAAGTHSLSFECRYQLTIIVTDYSGDANALMVCLMAWVQIHQRDLLSSPANHHSVISFEVDFINHETADYSIKLHLTEQVIVKQAKHGKVEIIHQTEQQVTPAYNNQFWKRQAGKSLLAEFSGGNA